MPTSMSGRAFLIAGLLCIFSLDLPLSAQQRETPPATPDDVVRVKTELIQSPVIVLDKQGNFVGGLSREQFELNVDGQVRSLSFFDEIIAGTLGEVEKYESASREPTGKLGSVPPAVYGRTVVFFIDDLHLDAEGVKRTRAALLNYIDKSLGQNDRALVISASGQVGFLQQLTDNKMVLRAAVERLKRRDLFLPDDTRPPMTAYQAMSIENGDSGTMQYFADIAVKDIFSKQSAQMPSLSPGQKIAEADRRGDQNRRQAEDYVKNRARNILIRYSSISATTLSSLTQSMASLSQLPGSKLVFFISDGFFLNQQISAELQKLNEITSSAMRAGTVVYSIQASGLGNSMTDASAEVRLSPRGERGTPMIGQDTALQAPLYTVAVDTGGRALFNSNSMDDSIRQALNETSKYYLLAWRPDPEAKRSETFHRVQVRVKDHPELTVRMQKGYFQSVAAKNTASSQPVRKTPPATEISEPQQRAEKMREALSALYPLRDLPMIVNLSFLDQPASGAILNIGTDLSVAPLLQNASAEKQLKVVDLTGVVLDDSGKTVSSFSGQLKFDLSAANTPSGQTISHVDELKVKPGLYQVRVAAREQNSGITGSAAEWILVPDLAEGKVTLSSLLLGDVNSAGAATPADQKAHISVNHHFSRTARLRFLTYIYNAARGSDGKSAPDITVQLRVMRDDKVLSTSPQIKVPTDGIEDLSRMPYAGELALRLLPPGRYLLSAIATDNASKSSYTQSVKFVVD
jgi:VWFA-related protein